LQTIPDDFYLAGGKDRLGGWIGNAVPTTLAEVLAFTIAAWLDGEDLQGPHASIAKATEEMSGSVPLNIAGHLK
jgi:hypothetical protein